MKSYELKQVAQSRTEATELLETEVRPMAENGMGGGLTLMTEDPDGLPAPYGYRYVVALVGPVGASAPTLGIWCLYPTRQYRANIDAFRATIPNA